MCFIVENMHKQHNIYFEKFLVASFDKLNIVFF